jgi:hypothetical protein
MGTSHLSLVRLGDQVAIIGAPTPFDGNLAVWARAIQKGSAMLVLRNADGTAKWTPATDGIDGCGVALPAFSRLCNQLLGGIFRQ